MCQLYLLLRLDPTLPEVSTIVKQLDMPSVEPISLALLCVITSFM